MSFIETTLLNAQWKFAKTMPWNPHHYTLKKTWQNKTLFQNVVYFINDFGKKEEFKKKMYTVLYLGDYKYWTMHHDLTQVILINRKDKNVY